MGVSGGPNIISDGLVFGLDAADPKTSKAGCMGFNSAEQLIKNLASTGDTVTSTSNVRLANLTFYTIYSQTYPEGDHNPSGGSGTRDGITPGFNNVTSTELLDFSRDLNYAVWNNKTNGWVADSYFNGERKAGHCYDTYDGEPAQHAQFQSDYEAIVNAFPDATHIVCGSHAAENNDSDSDTLAILKGLGGPSSWPTGRPEYILIGKPGLGAGNAYVWQYENDTTGRAHANVGLPILGGKKSGGNYLEFDGTDDYIVVTNGMNSLVGTNATTFGAWIYIDTVTSSWDGVIANKVNVAEGIALLVSNTQKIFFQYDSTSGNYAISGGSNIPTAEWTYIVATYDTVAGYKTYMNGELNDSEADAGKSIASSGDMSINIGAQRNSSGNPGAYFPGRIAKAEIYNKALSAAEIKSNYNQFKGRFGL